VPEQVDRELSIRAMIDAGDSRGAATEAIRAYGPQILRYLRSVLNDEDDAREAFGQFAENLWRGIADFRGSAPLRIWAYRIAWNVSCDLRKQPWNTRRRRLSTGEASRLAETIATSSNERFELRRRALAELRETLSPEDRALAALRLDQGFSWEECAEALSVDGKPVKANTLTKRFERIKERLGREAKRKGLLDP
jgi:RNA polymerase sigma-70 factor (ECF subfamily)